MQLILEDMLEIVRNRTKYRNNDAYLTQELNAARDWAYNAIMVMNEDILKNEDEQFTLSATTSSYDVGANVARPDMYAIKWIGVKLQGDTKFNPVQFMDSARDLFMSRDQDTASTTTHPIYCDTKNFSQVRFAPPLPSGAVIQVSYIYLPLAFDLETNAALTSSTYPGVPNPVNQAIVDMACAYVYDTLDDLRAGMWERRAGDKLRRALNVIDKRQWQQIPKIKGFIRHSSRRVF